MPIAKGLHDYIVGGATIASRLTESGAYKVLLLEAGTEERAISGRAFRSAFPR